MTIQPGVEVRFAPAPRELLKVRTGATLIAQGTVTQPITFTSNAATPAPGDWRSLTVQPDATVRLAYCDISYAGQGGSGALRILSSAVGVDHRRIHHSASEAIEVNGAQPTLRYLSIESNALGLTNLTPGTLVDARLNWWGHSSGPFHPAQNPGGQGQEVSDGVLFTPWLDSPTSTPCQRVNVNGIGNVDVEDVQAVAVRWRDSALYDPQYDVAPASPDGLINIWDIMTVVIYWGLCP